MAIAIPLAAKLERELAEYKIYIQQSFSGFPEYMFIDSRERKLTNNAIKNMFKRL
jgi:integrase/recombinase XerD